MGKETITRATFTKGLAAGIVVAASLGILNAGEYALKPETAPAAPDQEASAGNETSAAGEMPAAGAAFEVTAPEGGYTPGTYTASAKGIESDVTVTATFDENGITDLSADVSGETAGIGADIGDEMVSKILEAQSPNVDSVAGATITSDAVKTAVADAINQAGGSAAPSGAPEETELTSETEASGDGETEDGSALETESGSAAETEDASAPETEASSAAETEAVQASAPAGNGSYTPGTYTASAKGIESDVTVTVTFDASGITDITADVSGETAGIGAEIGDEMAAKVLETQSAQVDGVAGATITSDAFKAAVADCMSQASEGASAEETTEAAATETPATEAIATEAAVTEETTEKETEAATEAETQLSTEPEGELRTFTATSAGHQSDVTVTMDFDDNGIYSVHVDVSGETAAIGAMIDTDMEKKILEAQSADVDGISGATVSSDAVKAAAADCIRQAGGETAAADETEAAREPEGELRTFTATSAGHQSDVTVTMDFDDNGIYSVHVDVSGETAAIGAMIDTDMEKKILEAQSADVDGISGATVSSDAVKAAAADCIRQASDEGIISVEDGVIYIIGADGPTAVFTAGVLGGDGETETEAETEPQSGN